MKTNPRLEMIKSIHSLPVIHPSSTPFKYSSFFYTVQRMTSSSVALQIPLSESTQQRSWICPPKNPHDLKRSHFSTIDEIAVHVLVWRRMRGVKSVKCGRMSGTCLSIATVGSIMILRGVKVGRWVEGNVVWEPYGVEMDDNLSLTWLWSVSIRLIHGWYSHVILTMTLLAWYPSDWSMTFMKMVE